ncbi:FAD-dependent oxidoreductase [Pseudomonas corrugata]
MQTARIAIVGAGLSGLYAAYALQQKGVTDYVVLEARDVLGDASSPLPQPSPRVRNNPAPWTASTWAPRGSGLATNGSWIVSSRR